MKSFISLCLVERRCFDSKNAINWLKATFSDTVEEVGPCETGLLLLGFSRLSAFGIGVTLAVFQRKGNVPVTKDGLIIDVSVRGIARRLSFMSRIGILSIPRALFVGISWICLHSTV